MRHLLSIRGGGIRGIIPGCCLIQLERQLGGLTRDHIDFCGGTSTGALLAAAIAAGIPAPTILKLYTDRSKEIFHPTGAIAEAKRLAVGFMFESTNISKVLERELGAAAAWAVNDSPLRVMLTATAINGHNWFFVKDNAKNAGTTGSVKLVDAAVASACAPTYFDHWKIRIAGKDIRFFDGGVGGTGNPAYQACVEAFEYDDFVPAETRVIDLGTGFFPASDTPPNGILQTIGWTTSTLIDSSQDWVDNAVHRQWPGILRTFNAELPHEINEADLAAIPALVEVGQQLAATMDWREILSGTPAGGA